ncbi:hypothetical protein LB503_002219 [Fusarium chuoi]|nr:hypothetical protein LB503_002219 [Fusarium chuoi]
MAGNLWSIPLQTTNFNIVVAFLGGFISVFGLVSYLLKENYYLSEALISLLVGVAFGPHGANFIRPKDYAECAEFPGSCDFDLNAITLNFSRLVLGVQLVLAGVQLPSKYLSLSLLLGPGMTCMWLATSLLVWALAGQPPFLHALAIGACVTPTDPVLSAVIVKGKFADHNIPQDLQYLITAESGAGATSGGAADAMGLWFGMTWGYTILLSVFYGAVVGWVGKELLHFAEKHNYVDRESFLVFAIALALFVLGTCGMTMSWHASSPVTHSHGTTGSVSRQKTTLSNLQSTCSSMSPYFSGTEPTSPGETSTTTLSFLCGSLSFWGFVS